MSLHGEMCFIWYLICDPLNTVDSSLIIGKKSSLWWNYIYITITIKLSRYLVSVPLMIRKPWIICIGIMKISGDAMWSLHLSINEIHRGIASVICFPISWGFLGPGAVGGQSRRVDAHTVYIYVFNKKCDLGLCRLFHSLLVQGDRGLSVAFVYSGDSYRSYWSIVLCHWGIPRPYLDQPITKWLCQPMRNQARTV